MQFLALTMPVRICNSWISLLYHSYILYINLGLLLNCLYGINEYVLPMFNMYAQRLSFQRQENDVQLIQIGDLVLTKG